MGKKHLLTIMSVVLIAFIFTGCRGTGGTQGQETYTVTRQTIESTLTFSGTLKYEPEINVVSSVSGKVSRIYVSEGQPVKKDQPIIEIDAETARKNYENALNSYKIAEINYLIAKDTDLNNSLLQAEANLKSAQASYEIAKINLDMIEKSEATPSQIKIAEEQVKQAQINLDNAMLNLEAVRVSDITTENVNIADLQVKNAELSVAMAELNLNTLKKQGPTEQDIKIAEEQVKQANLNKEIAQKRVDEMKDNPLVVKQEVDIAERQVKIAESNLEIAQANLEKLKTHGRPEEEDINKVENQLEQAKIALEIAKENYNQALKARSAKELQIQQSEKSVEIANSQLEIAKANLDITQKNASVSEDSINLRREQLNSALAAVSNAEAMVEATKNQIALNDKKIQIAEIQKSQAYTSLSIAQSNLDDYIIKSPVEGSVLVLNVKEGDVVSGGGGFSSGTVVATIGNTSKFIVETYADEIDAVELKPGQTAMLTLDAFKNVTIQGKVSYVGLKKEMVSQQGIQAYKVKIEIPETELNLKSGLTTNIQILIDRKENVIAVPIESVITEYGKNYVEMVLPDGAIQRVEIEVGISSSYYTEVLSGLEEGNIIVLVPEESLTYINISPAPGGIP